MSRLSMNITSEETARTNPWYYTKKDKMSKSELMNLVASLDENELMGTEAVKVVKELNKAVRRNIKAIKNEANIDVVMKALLREMESGDTFTLLHLERELRVHFPNHSAIKTCAYLETLKRLTAEGMIEKKYIKFNGGILSVYVVK